MIHFIRLMRPINLLIITLTMYGLAAFFEFNAGESALHCFQDTNFFLLVASTVIIAASGNIINDYFDVKADRINKPHRVIVNKYIKRRVAILSHWLLSVLAFGIAVYLSIRLSSFLYLFVHLLSINLLWFYSAYFKRMFFIGNVVVAILTAIVPILVGFYYQFHVRLDLIQPVNPFIRIDTPYVIIVLSLGLAGFAFMLNLAREISKDVQDIEGDKLLKASTLAIVYGPQRSRKIINLILSLTLLLIGFFLAFLTSEDWLLRAPIVAAAGLIVLAMLQKGDASRSTYSRVNSILKLAMILGILAPVYWIFIALYV